MKRRRLVLELTAGELEALQLALASGFYGLTIEAAGARALDEGLRSILERLARAGLTPARTLPAPLPPTSRSRRRRRGPGRS